MKISTEDEFKKINNAGRHPAARLGRGFETRPILMSRILYLKFTWYFMAI